MRTAAISFILLLFVVLLAAPAVFAQPEQMEHKKKVFLDSATGKIYTPDGMPLYLRLATSPEADAETFLLRNAASGDPSEPVKPFTFEASHGEHSLVHNQEHWLKKAKKKPEPLDIFFVFEDGRAPRTRIEFSDVPQVVNKGRRIFGLPVEFTISASDDGSGVEQLYFSVDGSPFRGYTTTLSFATVVDFTVARYAVDNVGNAGKTVSRPYALDFIPPTTTIKGLNNFYGNVLSPKARLSLRSRDAKAGVKRLLYSFDDGEAAEYKRGTPLRVKDLSEGDHKLTYYAVDRVKNTEQQSTFDFFLDATPPETNSSILGDQYQGERLYVSARSRIEITATDNRAGVERVHYGLNKKKSLEYFDPFGLPEKGKHFDIRYYAVDRVGNLAKNKNLKVTLDTRPPKVKPEFDGEHYFSRSTHYVTSSTGISLKVSDDRSGVQNFSLALDGKPPVSDGQPITIPMEGPHEISYSAVDNVNNRSDVSDVSVFVDNTPPEIFNHFSVAPSEHSRPGPPSWGIFAPRTLLFLAATDEHAGVRNVFYAVNGGKERPYTSAIRFNKANDFSVLVRSVDNVGNESSREIRFTIRKD